MNKKFIGTTALAVAAVGGYLYYQHNKVEFEKKLSQLEDRVLAFLVDFQSRRMEEPDPGPAPSPFRPLDDQ